jgi:hypothetical protein
MTLRLVGKVVVAVSVLAVAGFAVAPTLKGPVSDKPFGAGSPGNPMVLY